MATICLALALLLAGCMPPDNAGSGLEPLMGLEPIGSTDYVPAIDNSETKTLDLDLGGVNLGSGLDLASGNNVCLLCTINDAGGEVFGSGTYDTSIVAPESK